MAAQGPVRKSLVIHTLLLIAWEMATSIVKDLSLNSQGQYTISPLEFSKIETALDESRRKYTYNVQDGTLRFIKPTWVHSNSGRWMAGWALDMGNNEMVYPKSLFFCLSDLHGFAGPFTGRSVGYMKYLIIIYPYHAIGPDSLSHI